MKRILVLHGPNLNLLGEREPEVYGTLTLAQLNDHIQMEGERLGVQITTVQSNHEGVLIDELHAARKWAIGGVINPGGLSHTSVSLRDAIAAVDYPVIEVHLSNIYAREHFRRRSLTAPACRGVISGLGWQGYLMGLQAIISIEASGR
ncbi:MAG: type II 3-dehydroquinate dehydratase [Anaerolineae bacterium]|nr:MAG: type II 3-dehydroquinate dehydratase [Anaerolineae bacterium]